MSIFKKIKQFFWSEETPVSAPTQANTNHIPVRANERSADAMRPIQFQRHFTKHAEGSVLVSFGDTKVLCTATIEEKVPGFLKGQGQGWLTAEYSMLPRSTNTRTDREAAKGKQSGRTLEIQRLIGRSLRAALDLKALGERTITIDCDVIQADGGTRTASISGAYVALHDAIATLLAQKKLATSPILYPVAAVSVGIHNGVSLLDLDYQEDSQCSTDMNIVMNNAYEFIEIQGTAEQTPFGSRLLIEMLDLAQLGLEQIFQAQELALKETSVETPTESV